MRRSIFLLSIAALLLVSFAVFTRRVSAREICFRDKPEVPACFNDPFSGYWESNGGLPVFGYPVTTVRPERNPDLNVDLQTQWTERNRLEAHPENRPPFNILLGRMGAERLRQQGRDPAQEGREGGPIPGCLWFETTGRNVCDQLPGVGFKTYWETHGLTIPELDGYGRSLQLFGYPLTSPRMETNAAGDLVLTQWFERARFEWHPTKPNEFKVLLGLLGNELRGNVASTPPAAVFGVEIARNGGAATAARVSEAGAVWTRYNGVVWPDVEASRGTRDWSRLAGFENDIKALSERGATPMVIVRGTPAWAQKVPNAACGPIAQAALDDFASFMRDLVTRYSGPPYNVKYWEIGNEPDVAAALVAGNESFGCWGDDNDAYYGGGYYAEMLKRVYPAVKQANPSAQIVLGGLLLDCDPTRPPAGKDCKPAKFLEGIFRNGGAGAFDIIAYHTYNYYSPRPVDWERQNPAWLHRGGSLLGKLDFLRAVQAQFGVQKPIIMNEGGLLCYPGSATCPGPEYNNAQANYVVRLYTRAWAHGLLGAVWYTLDGPGWREGGLLDAAQAPRPAYNTLKFLSSTLKSATFTRRLGSGALEGYAFRRGATSYQVYWVNDGSTVPVGLPAGTTAVYNKAGQRMDAAGSAVQVGFEPVIIEVTTP